MTLKPTFADRLGQRRSARSAEDAPDGAVQPDARPCVLVIDDEPEITRSVAELLGRDYRVLTAGSADEGLAVLASDQVAVILTDQRMPDGTGAELLARSVFISPETTRILFTGYSDISAVIDAVNEGQVYRYIAKPWQPEQLRATLVQGLERYGLVVENRRLLEDLRRANADLEVRVQERTRRLEEQNEELREARKSIEELSRRDALTGLLNRRWLDEVLAVELERARRYGAVFSVIMMDLDHFKAINDASGHAVGDQVLRSAARAFEAEVRMTDVLGRYGGEEFIVMLPNTGPEEALLVAERLRLGLRGMPMTFRAEAVTASFGVAGSSIDDTIASVVARADDALYEAKRTGRDRVAMVPVTKGEVRDRTDAR